MYTEIVRKDKNHENEEPGLITENQSQVLKVDKQLIQIPHQQQISPK